MIVDRRKDGYDELLLLARDARKSRAKTARRTNWMVAAAAIVTGGYVAVSNHHMSEMEDAATEAQNQLQEANEEIARLEVERDFNGRNREWFRDAAVALNLGDDVIRLIERMGPNPILNMEVEGGGTNQFSLANVVWIVDGSRRFPMAAGDILWVPEGEFWVRMEDPDNTTSGKPTRMTIHRGAQPGSSSRAVATHNFTRDGENQEFQIRVNDAPARGIANCIKLTWHEASNRQGFSGPQFIDMELLFYNNANEAECPSR